MAAALEKTRLIEAAADDPELHPRALHVLVKLCQYWTEKGGTYPSRQTIADKIGVVPRTVTPALRSLQDRGYIICVDGKTAPGKSAKYRLRFEREKPASPVREKIPALTRAKSRTEREKPASTYPTCTDSTLNDSGARAAPVPRETIERLKTRIKSFHISDDNAAGMVEAALEWLTPDELAALINECQVEYLKRDGFQAKLADAIKAKKPEVDYSAVEDQRRADWFNDGGSMGPHDKLSDLRRYAAEGLLTDEAMDRLGVKPSKKYSGPRPNGGDPAAYQF